MEKLCYVVLFLAYFGKPRAMGQQNIQKSLKSSVGRHYSVSGVTVDVYTAREHCRDHNGKLADAYDLLVSGELDIVIANLGLHTNTSYWVSGQNYFNGGCVTLFIQSTISKWSIVNTDCSDSYMYICHIDKTLYVPIILQMSEATSSMTIQSTMLICGSGGQCGNSMTSDKSSHVTLMASSIADTPLTGQTSYIVPSVSELSFYSLSNQGPPSGLLYSFANYLRPTSYSDVIDTSHIFAYSTAGLTLNYSKSLGYNGSHYDKVRSDSNLTVLCHGYYQQHFPHSRITVHDQMQYSIHDGTNDSLLLNEKSTSKYRRKKTSAADHRVSSQAMGFMAVVVLAAVWLTIAAMDAPRLCNNIRIMYNNFR